MASVVTALSIYLFQSSHLRWLNFQCSFGMGNGLDSMFTWIIIGRWSLPQYGSVFMVVRFARSGELKMRSMVELCVLFGIGLIPRFLGVYNTIFSWFRSIFTTSFPLRFDKWTSSQISECAFRSPITVLLLVAYWGFLTGHVKYLDFHPGCTMILHLMIYFFFNFRVITMASTFWVCGSSKEAVLKDFFTRIATPPPWVLLFK
jgi:hypothetical protein